MKHLLLVITAITLLSAENNTLQIQSINNNVQSSLNMSENWFEPISTTINFRELISDDGINSNRDYECNDPEACNYNPNAYDNWDCKYPEDYGWCDCEGTYYDCAGECGGSDDSCTIMYPDELGIYENDDCSGELISEIEGVCITDGEDYYNVYNEEGCLEVDGFWLPGDICYQVEYTNTNETDCLAAGGLYEPSYYYGCIMLTQSEYSTVDECYCGEGGIFEEDYEECLEGDSQPDYFWVEIKPIFDEGDGPPPLYFYDDFTWSEACNYDCQFDVTPSQEDCENAGGSYNHWAECDFDEVPSEDVCVAAGGEYYSWSGCDFDDQPGEEDCESVGGEYNSWGMCHFEDQPPEEDCESAGGSYDSWTECIFNDDEQPSPEECTEAGGDYNYDEEWCHIIEEDACNSLGGELYIEYYCYVWEEDGCNTLNGEWDGGSDCYVWEEDACNTLNGDWYEDSYCDIWDEDTCYTLNGDWYEEIECDVEDNEVCTELNGSWYEGLCPEGTYSIEGDVFTLIFNEGGPGFDELAGTISFDTYGNWTGLDFALPDWYGGNCIGFTFTNDPTMGIVEQSNLIPADISISSIYPNPFNPVSTISFEISEYGKVGLAVYNLKGEQVAELMGREYLNAGYHEIVWDASNFSSGIYFVTLRAGNIIQTKKITLLK